MTTPQQTLERAYAALNAAAFAHPSASDSIGTQCSEAAEEIRALLAQPAAAPPAPGGDVHDRRSETGMPMSANAPEKCPITRRPFFMVISHPELGWVPTYGGPYDSYTIPHMEGKPDEPYHERELTCHHYDHDYGGWVDDESISMRVINEGVLNDLLDAADALQSTQGQDAAPAEQPQGDDFEQWWVRHGQFSRAGGGDYEKTFAYNAWRAARAALESALRVALAPKAQWQPIETAPKDGTEVLLYFNEPVGCGVGAFHRGSWYEYQGAWDDNEYSYSYGVQPTHWMPLPAAPKGTP